MNPNGRSSPVRARTLEYKQAMKDFRTMFPSLEKDIIECVLRSNSGHVDSTIDQLLQLTQDGLSNNGRNIRSLERLYYTCDETPYPSGRISSELRTRLNSDDSNHPPKYTPTASFEPPPSAYTFSTQPVEPFSAKSQEPKLTVAHKCYRDWNPPLLGTLPHDFLRIVSTKRQDNPKKFTSTHHHVHSSRHAQSLRARPSSSRQSLPSQAASKTSPTFERSKHRQLGRRRTTGEVNVVLGPTMRSDRPSEQRMVMVENRKERKASSHRQQSLRHTSSNPSPRRRNSEEQSQYVEDRKFALLLQNEEFLRELRRNEQFLQELNKGNNLREGHQAAVTSPRNFQPISVDPLQQLPSTTRHHPDVAPNPRHQDNSEEKDFKDSLKHMSKSAKKSFNEIARRFYAKRKSYKSMGDTIDPIFANCEEDSRR